MHDENGNLAAELRVPLLDDLPFFADRVSILPNRKKLKNLLRSSGEAPILPVL